MSVTFQNGRPSQQQQQPRKQLADQLDRFDQLLDGLAEGLQSAITDAAREGTRCAVKDAILEVMNDPNLRSILDKLAQPAPSTASTWTKIKTTLTRLKSGVMRVMVPVVTPVVEKVRAVTRTTGQVVRALGITWQLRKMLAIGVGIGLATMGVSYLASHSVAAILSGIGGAVTAVVVQGGLWIQRSAKKLRMV